VDKAMTNDEKTMKQRILEAGEILGRDTLLAQIIKYAVTPKTIMRFVADHAEDLTEDEITQLAKNCHTFAKVDLPSFFDEMMGIKQSQSKK
jgi:hypothetical protein